MKKISLNGNWSLQKKGSYTMINATVPGSVYSDMLKSGLMEEPFWRDNEDKALRLLDDDYIYTSEFKITPEFLGSDKTILVCEGLDTLAEVSINGNLVGQADNMHRTWEFDVKSAIKEGINTIAVVFSSPTKYIKEAYKTSSVHGTDDAMIGFPLLRKAHCMFGWDWGPRLPDAGIWRNIYLLGINTARIDQVYITQDHTENRVKLNVDTSIELFATNPFPDVNVNVTITAPDGTQTFQNGDNCEINIDNPLLWWPNGFGNQPLYTVTVDLMLGNLKLDTWRKRIGLRTMTIYREKDDWGEKFCHRVNGVDIFAMGADYIPEDNIFSRINKERTRLLLDDAAAANFNCIRVWGGGYYPDDYFFDICDELGLIIWQDLMFSCAMYILSDSFERNIRQEVINNVRRIRHHASLGLWCGNNEMEWIALMDDYKPTHSQLADYIKMYEYIFPQIMKEEDPNTFYWPASPSSTGSFDNPNDGSRGDVHYWEVWHGLKPFTDYRNHMFRYVSEFGFQSFPSLKTIEAFTNPDDRNPFSYVMEKHQRNKTANGRILSYLSQIYLYPNDFDMLIYASQLLQAQAMQYGVEHWRRNRGRCMGAIIWQLNDCWPVASWSSIDYYGRWKALHYYMKRFFAPVLLSCHEEGLLSQEKSVNAELIDNKKTTRLNVSNETMKDFIGTVNWSLRKPDASIIESGSFDVSVAPLTTVWLDEQDFTEHDVYGCYFAYELVRNSAPISSGSVLFCPPKHFKFADPKLSVRIDKDTIIVNSKAYARSVEIISSTDVIFEDNFFDMNAEEKRIKVVRGNAKDVWVRSVFDIK